MRYLQLGIVHAWWIAGTVLASFDHWGGALLCLVMGLLSNIDLKKT